MTEAAGAAPRRGKPQLPARPAGRQPPSSAMLRSRPRGRRGLPLPRTADESRAVLTHGRNAPSQPQPQSSRAAAQYGSRAASLLFYGERPPLAALRRALARATPPRALRHHRPAPRPANGRYRWAAPHRRLPSAWRAAPPVRRLHWPCGAYCGGGGGGGLLEVTGTQLPVLRSSVSARG